MPALRAEPSDEIWVVDALIDEDDVLLVELDDFDAALVEEIVANEIARELAEAEEE